MSDRTTSTPSTSTPTTSDVTPTLAAEHLMQLQGSGMWKHARPEHRALLQRDMAQMVMVDGLPQAEYLEGLDTWGGTVEEYLTECGLLEEANPAPKPDGTEQAEEQAPSEAEQVAANVQRVARDTAAMEEAARAQAQGTLKSLVLAYRKGERAYARGLLEAGELCQEYITQRLELGDKRAAAVQTIEGQLAMYASDTVDVNRLVRTWAAASLLSEGTGLDVASGKSKTPPADNVPYGHYRDAWALLVQREGKDTAEERYVLLPGVESECLAAFKAAVEGTLSKAASLEKCQGLVREGQTRLKASTEAAAQKAKAEAAQAEEARRLLAVERAKAEEQQRAAAKAVAEEQNAERRAEAALQLAAAEADTQAKAKAEADAQAKAEAAAREKASADKAAAEAAEAKAKADAKAQSKADKAASKDKPATAAAPTAPADPTKAPECRGENVLVTLARMSKQAQPKDYAAMLASSVRKAEDPLAVVHELAIALLVTPEDAEYGPDDVLDAMLDAMVNSEHLSAKGKRAVKAALVILASKPAPSPAEVANALSNAPANGTAVKVA